MLTSFRCHPVYTRDFSLVEKLICTQGEGFFIEEDPEIVRAVAQSLGERSVYDTEKAGV